MRLFTIGVVGLALCCCTAAKEWLSKANYYQIYPRSFMDSNNDGVGDLPGIKSKSTYLKSLGMDAIWLSPIMKSPMKDHGYDISDFRGIHWEFGTLDDFDQLLAEFKKQGLHLILDFVPNHTSNEHEWFVKSENKVPGYEDYYIWHPGKPNPSGGRPLPPNNWLSAFRYSAWEWSDRREAYYYHVFVKEQPDLNYRNPKVVEEMKNVLRFWLDRGVAGFRCDTVPHLFEVLPDADGNLPDEPLSGDPNCDPDNYCYLNHVLTQVLPETYDMIYQWREVLDSYTDMPRVLLTEAYTSLPKIMEFYTDGKGRNGSHIPFNFELLSNINRYSTAQHIQTVAEGYMSNIPRGYEPNWVLGNHDQHRLASRLGVERAELYNILLQTLPGNAVTYQGEEITMQNGQISWALTQDPQACVTNETVYFANSRDPARTPMQWDSTVNAGFSKGRSTWLPVADNYKTLNVKAQEEASTSPLKTFKQLVQLHKRAAFQTGFYESAKNVDQDTFAYLRGSGSDTFLIVLNFGSSAKRIDLTQNFRDLTANVQVVLATSKAGFATG